MRLLALTANAAAMAVTPAEGLVRVLAGACWSQDPTAPPGADAVAACLDGAEQTLGPDTRPWQATARASEAAAAAVVVVAAASAAAAAAGGEDGRGSSRGGDCGEWDRGLAGMVCLAIQWWGGGARRRRRCRAPSGRAGAVSTRRRPLVDLRSAPTGRVLCPHAPHSHVHALSSALTAGLSP